MFDAQQKTLLWQKDLGYGWEMLGFSEDGSRLWMNYTRSPYTVMEIRSADGAQTELSIDFTIEDFYTAFESNLFLDQDKLLYILEADGLTQLERMDLNTGKKDLILPLEELQLERSDLSKTTTILLASENYVWILRKETVFVIDLQTGATRQLFSNVGSLTAAAWNDDRSQLAIAIGNRLLLASPDGTIALTIELGGKKGVSAFFYDEEILILCDNGKVERYDRQGNLLTTTALALYESFARNITNSVTASTDVRWWRTDDGNLVLNAFTAGNIIDCTHWQIKAFIPKLVVYVSSSNELVCNSGKLLHAFPRYTTEQQIRKALAALGDYRLTDEQLTYYGLN